MVFARSSIRASISKLFPRRLLFTQTPGDCGRDAQLAQSVQVLEKPFSHQGPFWPPGPRAHRYLGSVGLLGKPMLESLGFSQLQFVGAAGLWPCSSRHSRGRGSRQSQAGGAAAGAKPCWNVSHNHLHSGVAPAPTLTWAHLLLQQPSTHISFLLYQTSTWALSPPAWCNPQRSPCLQGWPPDTRWATQMFSFLPSYLLSTSNRMQWLRVSKVGIGMRGQAE